VTFSKCVKKNKFHNLWVSVAGKKGLPGFLSFFLFFFVSVEFKKYFARWRGLPRFCQGFCQGLLEMQDGLGKEMLLSEMIP